MTIKEADFMTEKEVRETYSGCSERDKIFLKAVLEMLVAIYCTTKINEKENKNERKQN